MSWLSALRLFRCFELYLALMFLVGTYLRARQYRAFGALATDFPGRWPRLLKLMNEHRSIFLTWGTVLPLILSASLVVIQMGARHWVWPAADLFTTNNLLEAWPALLWILPLGLVMIGFDVYGSLNVGQIDRPQMEKYFDQAEFWLKSPAARVVHFVTFGRINPRQMVATEVRSALISASRLINFSLWWISIQAGLRIVFGLALWTTYFIEPWILNLVSAE